MFYKIIEDCSPFFIRFTHPKINLVLNKSYFFIKNLEFNLPFTHYKFPIFQAEKILERTPLSKILNFQVGRVSMFVTNPGHYYKAHKDGRHHRYSINYTVKILDDKCETCWYSDNDLSQYKIDSTKTFTSRECVGFVKNNHYPIKRMTAVQGECILFNTDIFHDFDNSNSTNQRMVLTLRDVDPGNTYFEDAKNKIFEQINLS